MNRKRKRSLDNISDAVSKKRDIIVISDDSEFHSDEFEKDNVDEACPVENDSSLLIKLMYQVDLSVLCLLRKFKYNHKYPSLTLEFGETNNLGDIIIRNNYYSIHVKVQYVERHHIGNAINAGLFNIYEGGSYINHCFNSFVEYKISQFECSFSSIKYFIIYSNLSLESNQEEKQRPRKYYPFKLNNTKLEECDIIDDFLLTNCDTSKSGFYQISKNNTRREELLKLLKISPAIRKVLQEKGISRKFVKDVRDEFLNKLVFAVNQPDREELNTIVKNEFKSSDSMSYSYLVLQKKVLRKLRVSENNKNHKQISKIMLKFNLLMSLLQDVFLYKNILFINCERRGEPYDFSISYKDKISYIKTYFTDSNISYSHLFPVGSQEKNDECCINKYFTFFIQELGKYKKMGYFIVYTNKGLETCQENVINKEQSKELYPLRFDKMDIQRKKFNIFRYCSCIDENGLYQLSQEDKIKVSGMLVIPSSFLTEKKEWLSNINVEEIRERFLNKLVFAFNQPSWKEIEHFIKQQIVNASKEEIPYNFEELNEIALRCSESAVVTKEIMEMLLETIANNSKSYCKIISENNDEINFAKCFVGRELAYAFNKFLGSSKNDDGKEYLEIQVKNGINLNMFSGNSDMKKTQVNEISELTVDDTHVSALQEVDKIIINDDTDYLASQEEDAIIISNDTHDSVSSHENTITISDDTHDLVSYHKNIITISDASHDLVSHHENIITNSDDTHDLVSYHKNIITISDDSHDLLSQEEDTIIVSDESEIIIEEFEEHDSDKVYRCEQNSPLLISLMYQVDLSVLCLLRKSKYSHKYTSLSLVFGDSEPNKFSDIIISYNNKSVYIKTEYIKRYSLDNVISYSTLFTKKKLESYIDNCFNLFVEYWITNLDSSTSNIEYFIVYTNSCLEFTQGNELKLGKLRYFYPFIFDKIDIELCGIMKDFLFTDYEKVDSGFYKFSQSKPTREELLNRLQFSPSIQQALLEKNVSREYEKIIKEEFVNKLVFAVNQPDREKLNSIVKNEIENCNTINESYMALQKKVLLKLRASENDKKHKKVSQAVYKFHLLMSLLQDLFLYKNILYVSCECSGKPCDFSINYKDKISYIKVCYSDSNISYSHLFPFGTQEGNDQFCINKHFTFFAQELGKGKNMGYYIVYSNANLESTEQIVFNEGIFPLLFDKIDIQRKKYKIFRYCSFIDENGLYQLSQKDKTKVSSMLILPSSFLRKNEKWLSNINIEEIRKAFLNNLVFALNQPGRKKLKHLIEKEIVNISNKISYNLEELHEIALRFSESHETVVITKAILEKLYGEIRKKSHSSSEIPNKNINEEIKFARCVVGSYLKWEFNQFLDFLIEGEGKKYLEVLKRNGINISSISSILTGSGPNALKAFKELYRLLFDEQSSKTQYLKTLEKEGIKLSNMSSILTQSGSSAARGFKNLYDLWFDEKGNKTLYLKSLEKEGINLSSMASILIGSRANASEAFKSLYDLWFDREGNTTRYLNSLKREGIKLSFMSNVLGRVGVNAPNVFKELYDIWFDAKGNKTLYLKILEKEGINLSTISGMLYGARTKALKVFKDLYDLWFDREGNKTHYLKTLEKEKINLLSMSSILNGAGAKAPKAFIDLFNLWFDKQGDKTRYLKTLEKEGMNLSNVSCILCGAGASAAGAFKSLYDLWFDKQGNKTHYLRTLENEEINLSYMTSILSGARSNAPKAFKELYDIWFDAEGNKTKCLKILEKEEIRLSNMSSILCGARANGAKAFKDLLNIWFDKEGNKTHYLINLEKKGIQLSIITTILNGVGANASKAFQELYNLWFDAQGNKTKYLRTLEKEGIKLTILSTILNGARANAAKAFKELYDLWFDADGNKSHYLIALERGGINISNLSSILSKAGARAPKMFKDLYHLQCRR